MKAERRLSAHSPDQRSSDRLPHTRALFTVAITMMKSLSPLKPLVSGGRLPESFTE